MFNPAGQVTLIITSQEQVVSAVAGIKCTPPVYILLISRHLLLTPLGGGVGHVTVSRKMIEQTLTKSASSPLTSSNTIVTNFRSRGAPSTAAISFENWKDSIDFKEYFWLMQAYNTWRYIVHPLTCCSSSISSTFHWSKSRGASLGWWWQGSGSWTPPRRLRPPLGSALSHPGWGRGE